MEKLERASEPERERVQLQRGGKQLKSLEIEGRVQLVREEKLKLFSLMPSSTRKGDG